MTHASFHELEFHICWGDSPREGTAADQSCAGVDVDSKRAHISMPSGLG
jgi:hypothetical protein